MNPWQEDLEYFVEWMLLGEVERMPSGKRQGQPMAGTWMSYGLGKGMRGSDLRLRQYLCIQALARIGKYSIEQAAALVAGGAARGSHYTNVIRVRYCQDKHQQHLPVPGCMDTLGIWFTGYLSWRNWVLYSPEETLQHSMTEYRARYGQARARRLQTLRDIIRNDGDSIEMARVCTTGWDPLHFTSLSAGIWVTCTS